LQILESTFITIQEAPNGFNHIAQYNKLNGTFLGFVTSGNWEVTDLNGCTSSGLIYYTSTEISPMERHLFSILLSGVNKTRITSQEGWYSAMLDPWKEFYILSYGGPNVPTQELFATQSNALIVSLVNNSALAELLTTYQLPQQEFITIPIAGNQVMNAYLLLPPGFDNTKKYPLLMNVYGGPNSQLVTQQFAQTGFHIYVTSQLKFIVAVADGRGTGGRGSAWRKQVYQQLGTLETEDQLTAASYFQSLSYVASNRVGIWGWSYGGYMTCMTLTAIATPLSFGMSVAPVTDWRFYDSVYTERFMRTPAENPQGYNTSSVLNRATNLRGNSLLLAHGTADDNVHFQNSAELVKILIVQDIAFETMFYTNRDHSISQGARPHLYHLLSSYLGSK